MLHTILTKRKSFFKVCMLAVFLLFALSQVDLPWSSEIKSTAYKWMQTEITRLRFLLGSLRSLVYSADASHKTQVTLKCLPATKCLQAKMSHYIELIKQTTVLATCLYLQHAGKSSVCICMLALLLILNKNMTCFNLKKKKNNLDMVCHSSEHLVLGYLACQGLLK